MKLLFNTIFASLLICLAIGITSCSCGRKSRHAEEIDESRFYKVDVRSSLNIREKPSSVSKKLGAIPNGAIIHIEEIEGDWARINFDGVDVYVSASHLVPCDHNGNPRPNMEEVAENIEPESNKNNTSVAEENNTPKADVPDGAKNELSGARTEEGGFREVYAEVRDSAGIFTSAQKSNIIRAIENANLNITVVTVSEVDAENFFSYAEDIHDQLDDERNSAIKAGWFKRAWNVIADTFYEIVKQEPKYNKEHYTMAYDAQTGLLSAVGPGSTGKMMEVINQKEKYGAQVKARSYAYDGVMSMVEEYGKGKIKYQTEFGWWKKMHVQSASLFDYLSDEFIVQNILPNDSFFHHYVFGPLCKYPFKFAAGIVATTGSLILSMIIIAFIWLLMKFCSQKYLMSISRQNQNIWKIFIVFGSKLLTLFLWFCLLSTLVYAIPSMEKIVAMENGGYSASSVTSLLNQFDNSDMVRNWKLITFFIIGLVISSLGNSELFALNLMGKNAQMVVYNRLVQNGAVDKFLAIWGYKDDKNTIKPFSSPFTQIYTDVCTEPIGKKLGLGIPVALIINPGFMLIAGVYMWIQGCSFAINVLEHRREHKANGWLAMG